MISLSQFCVVLLDCLKKQYRINKIKMKKYFILLCICICSTSLYADGTITIPHDESKHHKHFGPKKSDIHDRSAHTQLSGDDRISIIKINLTGECFVVYHPTGGKSIAKAKCEEDK